MKINIKPDSVKWEDVKEKLQAQFPAYTVKQRSKGFLIVAKSGSIGANVLVRKKNIMVAGNFPTMAGSMVFMVYFAAFHSKMKALENEVGAWLKEAYADSIVK